MYIYIERDLNTHTHMHASSLYHNIITGNSTCGMNAAKFESPENFIFVVIYGTNENGYQP